jgi:Xaa-Pro dipeptidase
MSDDAALVREKLDQAVAILNELGIHVWMTFVRETSLTPDPALDLILGMDMVWQSAFIITRDNQRIAIVGKHDAENVRNLEAYTEVIPYLQDIREPLVETLLNLSPRQIALNYSEDDVAADGLSHGLMLLLRRYVGDTPLADRFISSGKLISALRGRKSAAEIERITAAVGTTQYIFNQVGEHAEPGLSEAQIAGFVHSMLAEHGLGTAWDLAYCPTLTAGTESPIGHVAPMHYTVQPGSLLHMDFGVKQDGFCADLQRTWYVRAAGEDTAPPEVEHAFAAVRGALMAGFAAMRPGKQGWEIDAAARQSIVDAGYPEYQHAFGHHVGRVAHDGATVLGPQWERYGQTPFGVLEEGGVFAIELGVEVPGYGFIGLEENVLVTRRGAEFISEPQTEIWLI